MTKSELIEQALSGSDWQKPVAWRWWLVQLLPRWLARWLIAGSRVRGEWQPYVIGRMIGQRPDGSLEVVAKPRHLRYPEPVGRLQGNFRTDFQFPCPACGNPVIGQDIKTHLSEVTRLIGVPCSGCDVTYTVEIDPMERTGG